MASSSRVKTRFLLLSDTHSRWYPQNDNGQLPKVDVLIHCGDLTMTGKTHEHEAAVSLIKSIDAQLKIVIPGNHDLTLDTAYYTDYGHLYGPRPKYNAAMLDHIRKLYTGPDAIAAGIRYLEEGTETFDLTNGARLTIYASAYTPEFCQWAFAYPIEQDRFNNPDAQNPTPDFHPIESSSSSKNTKNIDIFITHGPPHTILDATIPRNGRTDHVGCPHLLTAVSRSRPLLHTFGHIHEAWGAARKSWPPLPSPAPPYRPPPHQSGSALTRYTLLKDSQPQDAAWDDATIIHKASSRTTSVATIGTSTLSTGITSATTVVDDNNTIYLDGKNILRGEQTLFVNASVLDVNYQPTQRPWLVELLLPPCSAG